MTTTTRLMMLQTRMQSEPRTKCSTTLLQEWQIILIGMRILHPSPNDNNNKDRQNQKTPPSQITPPRPAPLPAPLSRAAPKTTPTKTFITPTSSDRTMETDSST